MANREQKNLLSARDQYNAYYGSFRGVDFASDHTEVDNSRFAYAVNVYKDYQSGQGAAVETIPGFRLRFEPTNNDKAEIYGIYPFDPDLSGNNPTKMLVHMGSQLLMLTLTDDGTYSKEDGAEVSISEGKSTSFKVGRYIYILSSASFLRIDMEGIHPTVDLFAPENAYVPIGSSGGEQYAQANMLADKVTDNFVTDGEKREFYFSRPVSVEQFNQIKVLFDGEELTLFEKLPSEDPGESRGLRPIVRLNDAKEIIGIKFEVDYSPAPRSGTNRLTVTYPYKAGFKQSDGTVVNPIKGCTISCVFDNRVFLSGNPNFPNYVFWSDFDQNTGLTEPSYFGELNFDTLGQSNEAISAMIPVANTLMVLKRSAEQDGAVYFLHPYETGKDLMVKAYQQEKGLNGVQCIGAATNFGDDPVFVSPLGLEAMGTLSVRYERAVEHRSSLVDPLLVKAIQDAPDKVRLAEWNGYLLVLCGNGKMFLADSRQMFTHHLTRTAQYEWYYLEDIGEYVGQTQDKEIVDGVEVIKDPEYKGGTFSPACALAVIDNNVFFGTEDGSIFSFNFDQRTEYGDFPHTAYNFNGRRYISGVATKMDYCGIPHLTKTTVKKSVVIKFRSLTHSAAKVRVRTNKSPYHHVDRVNSALFTFDDVDFGDFSFSPTNTPISVIPEKEKKWVEKQYYVFSDEFERPFSLLNLSYRFVVAGRYKE